MPTTTIADYQVLSDSSFELGGNTTKKSLTFNVPDDFAGTSGSRRPIIAFMVKPIEDSLIEVHINHREVAQFNLDPSVTRAFWEVWDWSTAVPNNTSFASAMPVEFLLTSGRARFNDVVMWYQVDRD